MSESAIAVTSGRSFDLTSVQGSQSLLMNILLTLGVAAWSETSIIQGQLIHLETGLAGP